MEKFNDALNSLDSLQKHYEIFVPSLGRKVKFKGLTTKQQKDAVKSALDKSLSGISFALLVNSIVTDNSLEKVNFLLTDRNYILVALRACSLSKIYKTADKEYDLSFVLDYNTPISDSIKQAEVIEDNIKLALSIPTIQKDTLINIEARKKLEPLSKDDDLTREAIGEMYIHELVKYIDSLTINNNGAVTELNFNNLNILQKLQVVEKLPLLLNNKVIEFINNSKALEKKYFDYNGEVIDIGIDQALFTV